MRSPPCGPPQMGRGPRQGSPHLGLHARLRQDGVKDGAEALFPRAWKTRSLSKGDQVEVGGSVARHSPAGRAEAAPGGLPSAPWWAQAPRRRTSARTRGCRHSPGCRACPRRIGAEAEGPSRTPGPLCGTCHPSGRRGRRCRAASAPERFYLRLLIRDLKRLGKDEVAIAVAAESPRRRIRPQSAAWRQVVLQAHLLDQLHPGVAMANDLSSLPGGGALMLFWL